MKTIPVQTPQSIEAGNISVMFHRAEEPIQLSDVRVEEGAEIVKIVAGPHTLVREEGQDWATLLAGKSVGAGVFINLHVKNNTTDARSFGGEIDGVVTSPVIQNYAPKSSAQGNKSFAPKTGGVFKQLPPIKHAAGGSANGPVAQGQSTTPRANAQTNAGNNVVPKSQTGTTRAGANNAMNGTGSGGMFRQLPPVVHNRSAEAQGEPGNKSPAVFESRPARRMGQVVTRTQPRVEYHNRAPSNAPSNARPTPVTEMEVIEAEVFEPGVIATPSPEVAVADNEYPVLFLRGHASALYAMIARNVPFNTSFRPSIMGAITRAMRSKEAPRMQGSADIVVPLAPEQIQALVQMMTRARGTIRHPAETSLRISFERAFALDQSITQARAERLAAARTG